MRKKRKDIVDRRVIIKSTGESVESPHPEKLEYMLFNDNRQIAFPLGKDGLYYSLEFPLDEIIDSPEFVAKILILARSVKPGTTTVCVRDEKGRYIIATEEDVRNALGLSERKYYQFMKEMKDKKIIKRQRFIHDNYYHYEFMINPKYVNLLLGKIGFSDFVVWKDEIIYLYDGGDIRYWLAKIPSSFAQDCVDALQEGEEVVHNKKLLKSFKGFSKREWKGIRSPRRKLR